MADEFAQFGGQEAAPDEFAQFGGQMQDAVSEPPKKNLRELAMALAQHIFVPQPLKEEMDLFKGLGQGAVRIPEAPTDTPAQAQGKSIGRFVPPVAGALAAGAALPVAAPLLATAAATGVGAAGGDLASMAGAKAFGGDAPETIGEAATAAAKTGAETALFDALGGGVFKAVKAVAPRFLQSLQIVPAESLKRVIAKPEVLRGGNLTQTGVELRGAVALRRVQNAVEGERATLGKAVESALERFGVATKGRPVINASKAADEAIGIIQSAKVSNAEIAGAIEDALAPGEAAKIQKIAEAIRKSPAISASDAIKLRRQIDDLTAFKKGGVQAISSDVGQRAAHALGAGLRDAISQAANVAKFSELAAANAKFSRFASGYDGISRDIGTKLSDSGALKNKLANIAGKYNNGGVDQARLENLKKIIPGAAKDVDAMLNMAAAREFLVGVKKTPSGISMSALRAIFPALGVAKGLPIAKQAEAITRILTRAGVAGGASKVNQ